MLATLTLARMVVVCYAAAQALSPASAYTCLLAVMARRLDVDHTLRLYGNPFKQSLYLIGSLGFVAAGLLLLRDPQFSADTVHVAMAYLCIGFFGLGTVVFLYSLARDLLMRRPVLQVDARGWTYHSTLGRQAQRVPWQAVGRIALYRQRVRSTRMYYLVLEARHSGQLPPSRARAVTAHFYPSMARAVMSVPLNAVFMRASPAQVEHLLHSVQAEFFRELQYYGIAVANQIQDM